MNIIRTCFISFLVAGSSLVTVCEVIAADSMLSADEWKFSAEIYGFLPDVEATSPSGDTIEIDIDDLLSNLDFTLQGIVGARKGKFLFMADLFYYKGSGGADVTTTKPLGITGQEKLTEELDIDMKNYFMTFSGGYNLLHTDKSSMDVLLGARYFKLDQEVELDLTYAVTLPISNRTFLIQASENLTVKDHVWDAVIGVRGDVALNNDWYLTYHADYGGGDSDHTWQAYGAIARKFYWGDVTVGYRHLEYEFDDTDFIAEMEYDGPMIGARLYF